MEIRKYQNTDFDEIAELFYNTVHSINLKDYSQVQVDVWATGKLDTNRWNKSLLENYSIVAIEGRQIVGFGDIDKTNYLDRLYVHKDFQGRGVATAICDELEKQANGDTISVHASITAKPFFEKRGYKVLKEQQVEVSGVFLINYVMEKHRNLNSYA
ncbi:GNAT family N-acetyltransferase [Clostridium sp. CS001]|uniref:GNAT family N-acetyltransferase n=1 Tax=Clostridium sp. CS001 TaxID=2880648 RepID=UPI001CF4D6C1|nr:GNAT family N-acetyltransferase [Clostridium sp. CS001]MCB2291377.1 GNAT family N-acetyltransferase [Clostridium sp. CS001]